MSGDRKGGGSPMLQATKLWRKISANGRPYLIGRLGLLRVLIFQVEPGDAPEDGHTHVLKLAAADERPTGGGAPKTALAERNAVAREIGREQQRIAERRRQPGAGRE